MFAFKQSEGKFPELTERWKMFVNAGAIWLAHVFSIMLAILSGPCAFAVLMPRRSFSTPSAVMRRGDIGRLALFLVSGSCWSSSRVKVS